MNDLFRRMLFLPPQGSATALEIDRLHYFVIGTTLVTSTIIGVLAVYFMGRYRRRRANQPTPHIECPIWLESLFVIVPISFFLLWFRIGFAQFVDMTSPPTDAVDVYVTGKKWMWKFAYPTGPNGLDILRVPAERPIRLLLTSRDVIHGFYVPAFRIKQDALPGRYTQTWFRAKAGSYPVFCSQYCGTGHSTMRARIVAMPADEFDQWMAGQKRGNSLRTDTAAGESTEGPMTPDMISEGQDLAARNGCLKCHSIDGSRHIGPTWRGLYRRREPLEAGDTIVADEAYLTESMMDPKAKVVAGFNPVMPSFFGKLDAPSTAALVEYIKSLRDDSHPNGTRGILDE